MTSIRMKTIRMTATRKFVYATLLALTSLNFAPSLASAQEMATGKFTLKHEVHWQNAIVPAGEYRFAVNAEGPTEVLMLSKLDGRRAGFMLMVRDTDDSKTTGPSQLVLKTTAEGSYVSQMQLPEYGMTLHFRIPESSEKQIARAVTAAPTLAQ
jgi:hypothetical protein